jgi:hypothetical protein
VRVDAFTAADAAVLATPNAPPPTITVPGTLTLRMTTTVTVASLQVVDADVVGDQFPGLAPLRTALVQRLSTPITTDLTQSLGAPPRDAPPAGAGTESPVYVDLPGLVETLPVPGFEDAPVAIAGLEDGTQLVLNRAADGSTRVAGTYTPASSLASRSTATGPSPPTVAVSPSSGATRAGPSANSQPSAAVRIVQSEEGSRLA